MHAFTKNAFGIAALGFILFVATDRARAQEVAEDKPMHGQHEQMSGPVMEECKSMMSARRQAKAEMKAASEKLDALMATMSTAEGDAKMEAMAKVVTELAAQQDRTMSGMMDMQPRMMRHMTTHMQMEMKEGSEGAMECPMMKEMEGKEKHHSNR